MKCARLGLEGPVSQTSSAQRLTYRLGALIPAQGLRAQFSGGATERGGPGGLTRDALQGGYPKVAAL